MKTTRFSSLAVTLATVKPEWFEEANLWSTQLTASGCAKNSAPSLPQETCSQSGNVTVESE